jgi:broad specificity phosphatase PhoE
MHITLIRHLPTEWNKEQKLQGRKDIDIITDTAEYQNGILANQERLREVSPFDLVLASTLKRTMQTAKAYGFIPETESLLDELDFGPFEGGHRGKLFEAYGAKWVESPKELTLGESIEDLENRIISFLYKYRFNKNILVFGHGSWIRALISYHQFGDINRMNQVTFLNNECITLRLKRECD